MVAETAACLSSVEFSVALAGYSFLLSYGSRMSTWDTAAAQVKTGATVCSNAPLAIAELNVTVTDWRSATYLRFVCRHRIIGFGGKVHHSAAAPSTRDFNSIARNAEKHRHIRNERASHEG